MHIHVTYDSDFDDLMLHLRGKYPKKLFDIDGTGKQTDISEFSKEFFSTKVTADVSVDDNANVDDNSIIVYNTELPKPFFRINSYYLLWKMLKKLYGLSRANEIIEQQIVGDIYINDSHNLQMAYCFNYSTYDIALLGLPMIKKIKSIPPKYLFAFKSQLEQFVTIASNSTLGATGLADLFITMAYYVDRILETKSDAHFKFASEEDCWIYIRESIASFIYTVNQPMRANQSPFTNVSLFDDFFLRKLCPDYRFMDGKTPSVDTVKKLQMMYLDIMNEEMERTPVTFPVTTACFSIDDENNIRDELFAYKIAEQNLKFGFINIYCGKLSSLSSCCRLRSEMDLEVETDEFKKETNEYSNSFGAGSSKIGSLGVCSVNFPRLAYRYKGNEAGFFKALTDLVENCTRVNNAKRHLVKKRIDNGNLPLYSLGFMSLNKQYSTIGVNGLNECCEIMGYDILQTEGQEFILACLKLINDLNLKNKKLYKAPHNVEQIPGESASIKLAKKDVLLGYQDGEYQMYSNQFIPLTTNADMLDRIKLQGLFDQHFSGGSICHLNVEEKIKSPEKIVSLIKLCAKMGVVYWAVNYNIQRCANEHITVGKLTKCPVCNAEIKENFTRVVGFMVPVSSFSKVRREVDYPNRQFYGELYGNEEEM